MSQSADVRSLSQLQALRDRLTTTRGQTLKEVESLQTEINKITRWLEDEAAAYWQQQMVQAERWLNECREALMRCQATVRADEKRPCTDERKRVDRAMERRSLCEKKLRAVREACILWQKEVVKLRGRMQHVADMADADLMVANTHLDQIIATLQTYMQIRSEGP